MPPLLVSIFLSVFAGIGLMPQVVFAETTHELHMLRQEIEALKEGHRAAQEELAEIKRLLVANRTAHRSPVEAFNGVVSAGDLPAKGESHAKITLIEFFDYQCPFCVRYLQHTMPRLEKTFIEAGQVRYVFRDFPIDAIHPKAFKAHVAARCAGDQGQYWAMHDDIFGHPENVEPAQLTGYAEALGLDLQAFNACLEDTKSAEAVHKDMAEGYRLGVRETPTLFLGLSDGDGSQVKIVKRIQGAQPYTLLKQEIERLLTLE